MIKQFNSYILFFFFTLALFAGACKKEDTGYSHNPSASIQVNSFTPLEGDRGTVILINGSNFTSDTSQIKVSINGTPLKIVGVKENQVMAYLTQKTGTGPVSVAIGGQSGTSTDNFTYRFSYEVTTLAGSGNSGFTDGKGAAASFNFNGVRGQLCVDDNLNVYVPDGGNQVIRKITPDGTVTTIAGSGARGFNDGEAALAQFDNPCGTLLDANGNVYISERNGHRIRKLSPNGMVSTYAHPGDVPGGKELTSMAINKKTGDLYWSDFYGDGIYRLKNGSVVKAINYSLPCTITMDGDGNVYATHYDAQTVRKYTYNSGTDTYDNGADIAGKDRQAGLVDGIGSNARFDRPWGIALDGKNNLYVGGEGDGKASNCIRMITPGTWNVTTIAGVGERGYTEGTGSSARFKSPTGIAVDKNGDMYVLDMGNNRVRKITVK